jgi:hypothetical protein
MNQPHPHSRARRQPRLDTATSGGGDLRADETNSSCENTVGRGDRSTRTLDVQPARTVICSFPFSLASVFASPRDCVGPSSATPSWLCLCFPCRPSLVLPVLGFERSRSHRCHDYWSVRGEKQPGRKQGPGCRRNRFSAGFRTGVMRYGCDGRGTRSEGHRRDRWVDKRTARETDAASLRNT